MDRPFTGSGVPAFEFEASTIRKKLLTDAGVNTSRWKIFEMSGTAAGQELAWGLLVPAATLGNHRLHDGQAALRW